MNTYPSISVIVPIYNVEKYLPQCIESILNQTLTNIEIILLNDGSTDRSLSVCEKYATIDKRITLLSHSNIGLGETRNCGIDHAKGSYLAFVDSDDYLEENFLETLYNKALESDADIVETETYNITDSGEKVPQQSFSNISDIKLSNNNAAHFYKSYFFPHIYKHNAWDKIYRRQFVVDNHLRFGDNKKIYAEDTWFQLQALFYYPKIAFTSGTHYCYHLRDTSITHTMQKNLVDREALMIDMYDAFLKKSSRNVAIEKKVGAVLSIETITLEALNQTHFGGSKARYLTEINKIEKYPNVLNDICSIYKIKAYELEPNTNRRIFIKLFSALYCLQFYPLANNLMWLVYKAKEKPIRT